MRSRHTTQLRRQALTIRPAAADLDVQRLAVLDSQPDLVGAVVIAEVGDEPWAAVEISSGRTVADPFRPSAGVAALARARAAGLRLAA